jgi:hypothetical protein
MNVRFKVRGVEAVQAFLKSVPYGATKVALQAFSEYIVGNDAHGLKHNEPYRYITRKSAYGFSFFTDKQKRWFFWALKEGIIDPGSGVRTGTTSAAWKAEPRNDGFRYTITNNTAGGYYTRDDKGQARQLQRVGWRRVSDVLANNYLGAIRAAISAVSKYLKSER